MAGVPASAPMGRVQLGVTLSLCVGGLTSTLWEKGQKAPRAEEEGTSQAEPGAPAVPPAQTRPAVGTLL